MDVTRPLDAEAAPAEPAPEPHTAPNHDEQNNGHAAPFSTAASEPASQSSSIVPPEEPSLAVGGDSEESPLEARLRQLEETLKEIQRTRVTDRPAREPLAPLTAPPLATTPLQLALPPVAVVATPHAPPPIPVTPLAESKRDWLFKEMWLEARAIQYMFFDPRYTMPWGGRMVPLFLLAAFVTTHFWLPGVNLLGVGWILDKVVQLLLGFALFKVLGHEARRYRETAPDLPPWLRL